MSDNGSKMLEIMDIDMSNTEPLFYLRLGIREVPAEYAPCVENVRAICAQYKYHDASDKKVADFLVRVYNRIRDELRCWARKAIMAKMVKFATEALITSLDGAPLKSFEDLLQVIGSKSTGQKIIHNVKEAVLLRFKNDKNWNKEMARDFLKERHWTYSDPWRVNEKAHFKKGMGAPQ